MDGRRRREVKETFDLGLGFVGFFTLAFFAITLFLELTGRDALIAALTTLALALLLTALWVLRRRMLGRPEGP
jgi:hypothetical protein